MDFFDSVQEIIHQLEAYHDSYTKAHECMTGRLMGLLSKTIGLDSEYCLSIEKAGSIHDIGKLAVPSTVLEKPGSLSAFEREVVELHVEIGYEITKKIQHPLGELASVIALTHHEAYDGSGYPHNLKGEQIPLEGRICTICDVYDALISHRPYRDLQSHDAVIKLIQDTGPTGLANKFDPMLLEAFVSISGQINELYKKEPARDKIDPAHR